MIPLDSQNLESYVPVYDAAPKTWEEGMPFIVEQLKKLANAVNVREIGFYLDQELLSGKAFIPGLNQGLDGGSSQQFRTILRKVIIVGPISAGGNPNTIPHGISVDANFTLIQLWASATNSTTFRSVTFSNPDTIWMDATNIYIDSDNTYDRCYAYCEYIQEP
jgi:hypothetical protein